MGFRISTSWCPNTFDLSGMLGRQQLLGFGLLLLFTVLIVDDQVTHKGTHEDAYRDKRLCLVVSRLASYLMLTLAC